MSVAGEPGWPRTLGDAVARIVAGLDDGAKATLRAMPERGGMVRFHMTWGRGIRNAFGLWRGNVELLRSCGGATMDPDDASTAIMMAVWDAVNGKGSATLKPSQLE